MSLSSPTNRQREHFARRSLLVPGLFVLLISACGLPSVIQPPSTVATVPPPAPTQKPVATKTSIPTNLPANTAGVPPSPTPPPSTPPPPKISHGDPDGQTDQFGFFLDFNPDYFLRMYVYPSDNPDNDQAKERDGQGILSVKFTITALNGNVVYDRTEKNPGYCIFGGGEPDCNPWVFEDGQYKWKAGGTPVHEGNYRLDIIVTAENGNVGFWFWNPEDGNPITIEVSATAQ